MIKDTFSVLVPVTIVSESAIGSNVKSCKKVMGLCLMEVFDGAGQLFFFVGSIIQLFSLLHLALQQNLNILATFPPYLAILTLIIFSQNN